MARRHLVDARASAPHQRVVLAEDLDRRGSWNLEVDGTPQSHVDLTDPTNVAFEYVRRLTHLVDVVAPEGEPISVLHLGAGGLTLARYVGVTRPGSRQRAVDTDAEVSDLVRRELPLPRGVRCPVEIDDARAVVARRRPGTANLVVSDVFADARVPAACTSVEYLQAIDAVLTPNGVVALNVGDTAPFTWARRQVATVAEVFSEVALMAAPRILRGRAYGNLVVLGSGRPLPSSALARRCASDPEPARWVGGTDIANFIAGARPLTDADATDSPPPPVGFFGKTSTR